MHEIAPRFSPSNTSKVSFHLDGKLGCRRPARASNANRPHPATDHAAASSHLNRCARYQASRLVIGSSRMFQELIALIQGIGETLIKIAPVSIALGTAFTVLSLFWACNPGRPWWRKRELVTDLCYWFIIPLVARYLRIGLLVMGAALLFGITTGEGLVEFYQDGHGPLAQLPLWLQGAIFLGSVAADVALLLAGISPNVFVFLGPLTIAHSAFVHANLNWTLGPFKYVLAGPVFHRWHHTMPVRGGEKNFASTFPVLDLLFGTFYMPPNELPDAYGIADRAFPPTFAKQMLYPFKR